MDSRSAEVAVWLAYCPWRPFVFHWLPTHASWLSFVEALFAILSEEILKLADLPDFDVAERTLTDFIATYNALVVLRQLIQRAHLRYRWPSRPTTRRLK